MGEFSKKTVLVTGATGLIGKSLVSSLLEAGAKVIAVVRSGARAREIFDKNGMLEICAIKDISEKIEISAPVDYIIHTASVTSSKDYVEHPVETLTTCVLGTKNILELAIEKNVLSVVFLSSLEVYGLVNSPDPIKEEDYHYINHLNARNSYPEGKRAAEAFCAAYSKEFNVPVKIARLAQTFGNGVEARDNRVFAQFARSVAKGADIVLHTKGETTAGYCHIKDAITAIFTILLKGKNGEAYNVQNPKTVCTIREMAQMLSEIYGVKVKFDISRENTYLPEIKLHLDTAKLQNLGWQPKYGLEKMFEDLIEGLPK